MKKLLCLLLSMLLLLSLAACDSSDDDDDDRSSRRRKKDTTSETGAQDAVATDTGYEQAIEDMVDMYVCRATKEQIYRMFPDEAWEVMGIDKEDHLDDYSESAAEQYEEFVEDYGDNFDVTYKIKNEEAYSDDDLDELKEYLSDTFDIKESTVTAAYDMELYIYFDAEEVFNEDVSVAKIGSSWYLLNFLE